jgi:hypothetical protein
LGFTRENIATIDFLEKVAYLPPKNHGITSKHLFFSLEKVTNFSPWVKKNGTKS